MDDYDLDDLIAELVAGLDCSDLLLWSGWLLEHKASEIKPQTLAELQCARALVMAEGLLASGPADGETVH